MGERGEEDDMAVFRVEKTRDYTVTAMGAVLPETDRAKLAEDLDNLIDKYMSITSLHSPGNRYVAADVGKIICETEGK